MSDPLLTPTQARYVRSSVRETLSDACYLGQFNATAVPVVLSPLVLTYSVIGTFDTGPVPCRVQSSGSRTFLDGQGTSYVVSAIDVYLPLDLNVGGVPVAPYKEQYGTAIFDPVSGGVQPIARSLLASSGTYIDYAGQSWRVLSVEQDETYRTISKVTCQLATGVNDPPSLYPTALLVAETGFDDFILCEDDSFFRVDL